MIHLTSMPSFGFQTATCNAEGWYKNILEQRFEEHQKKIDEKIKKVSPNYTRREPDQSSKIYFECLFNKSAKTAWKTDNYLKIAGYFPLIGSFIGLWRISSTIKSPEALMPHKTYHIIRGCVELLSIGCLLFIIDVIVTVYRERQDRNLVSA